MYPCAKYWTQNCSWLAGLHLAWQPLTLIYECVREWANVTSVVKASEDWNYARESPFKTKKSFSQSKWRIGGLYKGTLTFLYLFFLFLNISRSSSAHIQSVTEYCGTVQSGQFYLNSPLSQTENLLRKCWIHDYTYLTIWPLSSGSKQHGHTDLEEGSMKENIRENKAAWKNQYIHLKERRRDSEMS